MQVFSGFDFPDHIEGQRQFNASPTYYPAFGGPYLLLANHSTVWVRLRAVAVGNKGQVHRVARHQKVPNISGGLTRRKSRPGGRYTKREDLS